MRAKASASHRGMVIPPEQRAKISAALRGRPAPWMNQRRGIARPPEVRAKISTALMGHPGHPMGPEARERARRRMTEANPFKGKQHGEETRRKMSEAVKAAYARDPSLALKSLERIRRLQRLHSGTSHSTDTRRKIGDANRGKRRSPETRARLSAAHRTPSFLAFLRQRNLRDWQDAAYVQKVLKSARSGPNRLERMVQAYLNDMFPAEWYFNTGQVSVEGKIPDFVRTDGIRVCIDAFGDYWHRDDKPRQRQRHFRRHGWCLVIIWEGEFKTKPTLLRQRVQRALANWGKK